MEWTPQLEIITSQIKKEKYLLTIIIFLIMVIINNWSIIICEIATRFFSPGWLAGWTTGGFQNRLLPCWKLAGGSDGCLINDSNLMT